MDLSNYKVFVVGTGGIGCELLYSLIRTGFRNIEAIDKDTIELSNLNRQFLFRTSDISRSKVETAKDTLSKWFPELNMVAHHADIIADQFNVHFYKKFDVVINALDNQEARTHVNRMCYFANVPLVDGGTGGYFGQATPILWGKTECYSCIPHDLPETYPICTIRNNPTKIIHCVVWAKNVYDELFGEHKIEVNSNENLKTLSHWYKESSKHVSTLLKKLFFDDIKILQKFVELWEKREPPKALSIEMIEAVILASVCDEFIKNLPLNNDVFEPDTWVSVFKLCFEHLKDRAVESPLTFDKDDDISMAFVSALSNIKAHLFGIELASCFKIKEMAGNIVPSISTTNDIIASFCVIEALKILTHSSEPKEVYLTRRPMNNKIIFPMIRPKPNPECVVCSGCPLIRLACKPKEFSLSDFKNKILDGCFSITGVDVHTDGPSPLIIISYDDCETEENLTKPLEYFEIKVGSILCVYEYSTGRHYKFIIESDSCPDGQLFVVLDSKIDNMKEIITKDLILPKKRKLPPSEEERD